MFWRPIVDRSQDTLDASKNRWAISAHLSYYLEALNSKCIIHFAVWDTLQDCAMFYYNDQLPVADWADYGPFKRVFMFEQYIYCFHCGVPNDTMRNNFFQPAAHLNMVPSNCVWKHLVFKTIFPSDIAMLIQH